MFFLLVLGTLPAALNKLNSYLGSIEAIKISIKDDGSIGHRALRRTRMLCPRAWR
jgi:hypothetical protein